VIEENRIGGAQGREGEDSLGKGKMREEGRGGGRK
jgi:hypothetical protein